MRVRIRREKLEPVAEPLLQLQGERRRLILADVPVQDDIVRLIRPAGNSTPAGDGVDGAVQRTPRLTRRRALDPQNVDVFEVILVDRLGVDEVHGPEQIPRQRAIHAEGDFQRLRELEVVVVEDDRARRGSWAELVRSPARRRLIVRVHRKRGDRVRRRKVIRQRCRSVTEHGLLFEPRISERIRHPHVGRPAAEDPDAAPHDRFLPAIDVVVEPQPWRPQDVAARGRAGVDGASPQRGERDGVERWILGRRRERGHVHP